MLIEEVKSKNSWTISGPWATLENTHGEIIRHNVDNFHKKRNKGLYGSLKEREWHVNGLWKRMTSLPERGGELKTLHITSSDSVIATDSHCCPLWCVSNVLNTFACGAFTLWQWWHLRPALAGIFQPNASGLASLQRQLSRNCICISIRLQAENRSAVRDVISLVWSKHGEDGNELTFIRHYQRQNLLPSLSTFWGSVNTNHCFAGRCCWRLCGYSSVKPPQACVIASIYSTLRKTKLSFTREEERHILQHKLIGFIV